MRSEGALWEYEFTRVLEQYLRNILGAPIISNPRLGIGRPDVIAIFPDGLQAIIDAKVVTPNTQQRIDDAIRQLKGYADKFRQLHPNSGEPELILAVPTVFSPRHVDYLNHFGIDRVIDGPALRAAGADPGPVLTLAEPDSLQPSSLLAKANDLIRQLDALEAGRSEWSTYQKLCGQILSFLLSPPLDSPIRELPNWTGVNRRDFVLPNYVEQGFWFFMQRHYQADYIVVDAKNYVGKVGKEAILQLANYLSSHGAGLFGMIMCRNGADRSADLTRREQWVLHRKLIIILADDDIRQMTKLRTSDSDPSDLLRQQIEDFRLGF